VLLPSVEGMSVAGEDGSDEMMMPGLDRPAPGGRSVVGEGKGEAWRWSSGASGVASAWGMGGAMVDIFSRFSCEEVWPLSVTAEWRERERRRVVAAARVERVGLAAAVPVVGGWTVSIVGSGPSGFWSAFSSRSIYNC